MAAKAASSIQPSSALVKGARAGQVAASCLTTASMFDRTLMDRMARTPMPHSRPAKTIHQLIRCASRPINGVTT